MKKGVCQICKKDGSKGTGFFCKFKKDLPVFITNNHVINEKFLIEEKDVIIKMNDGKNIKINHINIENRFKYTNKDSDIAIIKIDEKKTK